MEKHHLCLGLLAHVDAGKTTLSEAMLYECGSLRSLGRVDHANTLLDSHELERKRGITIFSKQALLSLGELGITLMDTPGHADLCAEAERTIMALDSAILVISGAGGVQAHTLTLWQLLQRYNVPTFIFINKTDLDGFDKEKTLAQLWETFGDGCIDFSAPDHQIRENCALCDEALLETYLQSGAVTDGNIQSLIATRKIYPCCFGSALKLEGVAEFLQILQTFLPREEHADTFGARVYKITHDPQGNRLTWLKLTGGALKVRSVLRYVNQLGEAVEEKVPALRLYSGDRFTTTDCVFAGQTVAVPGLTQTFCGMALGAESTATAPILEPVMIYRISLPAGADPMTVLPKLRQLEEEDPLLHLVWENGQIHVQIMGQIQQEIFRQLVKDRFNLDITLEDRRIFYKETIENSVEGIGHFEPLRHYAEVHLLLEPLPRGSGLQFDSTCSTDVLNIAYQKLIISHMGEKSHRGVLTGAPITDMKITLLIGKAHLKHTEGGDMREATYRAIRQGLMQAKSVLLEPWYKIRLTVPTPCAGRAITDIRAMSGEPEPPEMLGEFTAISGRVPASELGDYADQVASYTQGRGRLQMTVDGYAPCHNTDAVLAQIGYDPEADTENPTGSVFCSHGAGFYVKWDQVREYMHLESGIKDEKAPQLITQNLHFDDKELEAIMEREFGPIKRPQYSAAANRAATESVSIRPPRQQYLIVDGYNVIFAREDLTFIAKEDLESARRKLCDELSSYAGYKKCRVVAVFDGWKVKGNPGEKIQYHNIQVVFTKENETADAYIESFIAQIGNSYQVRVATSDAMVQLSSLRSGVLRMSARELREELISTQKEMQLYLKNNKK